MAMVESKAAPETKPKLSAADRLTLIQTLNALPSAQFEELLIALNPPNGNIPNNTAPQAHRSAALFQWVESPIGPGTPELEAVLGLIIATQSKIAEEFLSFAISGKINSKTIAEVKAIVELLRKKTGDDSIDVAFFKEGSINIILSGSSEGLKKLQELFESGELNDLEIPPIEAVNSVDTTTTDARKTRLVQTLRLARDRSTAITSARYLNRYLDRARDLTDYLIDHLDHTSTLNLNNDTIELTNALSRDIESTIELVHDLTNTLNRNNTLNRDLAYTDLTNTNLGNIVLRQSNLAEADLTRADLSGTNLTEANLTEANLTGANLTEANLTEANLTGANLTEANLTRADVTETVFGENLGLTEANKLDLQQRGAILLDPPSSDVPSLVPV